MMRRSISLLLAVLMVVGMLPVSVMAEGSTDPVVTEEETVVASTENTESICETETTEQTESVETEAAEQTESVETEAAEQTDPEETEAMVQTESAETEATEQTEPEESEATEDTEPDEELEWGTVELEVDDEACEALLEAFVTQLFYGDSGISFYSTQARDRLPAPERYLFDKLKPTIRQIALGNRSSTVVEVNVAAGGYKPSDIDVHLVLNALYHDCPFEMYWYRGCAYRRWSDKIEFFFYPSKVFQPSNYNQNSPTIDASRARRAAAAADNAKSIVRQYAGYSDYNKMCAYADKICSLVKYDYYAADNDTYQWDITPWTLVNTFDNDPSTNIVCEGYAESFQYLFELSTFRGDVECYSPVGANHKWNIVRINGLSYLLDVCHCDKGSSAERGAKFFGGGPGSIKDGYKIGNFHYWYYDDTIEMFGSGPDSILKLAPTSYKSGAKATTMSQEDFKKALTSSKGSYTLSKGVTLTSDLTLENVTLTIASGGYLSVSSDAALKLKNSASITINSGAELYVDSGAYLVKFGTIRKIGTLTVKGTLCDTVEKFVDYIAKKSGSMSKTQIRAEMQALDTQKLMKAMAADTKGYDILYDIRTLEKAVGGSASFVLGDGITDFHSSSASVIGASLNHPFYSNTPIVLRMDPSQSKDPNAVSNFRLSLSESQTPINLGFPVSVSLNLPTGINSANVSLYRNGTGGYQPIAFYPNYSGKITFVTDTLGDFSLRYPQSGKCGDNAFWSYNEKGHSLIISGSGETTHYSTTSPPWKYYMDKVTHVTVDEGITAIGNCAFKEAGALQSVSLPSTLEKIGDSAFENCWKLTEVILPRKLTSIGNNAFKNCQKLTQIKLPSEVTTIGTNAFYFCTALERIFFAGKAPASIKSSAFYKVTADVYYPNDGTWTDSLRQNYGGSLTWKPSGEGGGICGDNLYWLFNEGTGELSIVGFGAMYDLDDNSLWQGYAEEITHVELDSRITTIGASAFAGLDNLTSITIPGSVTTIGAGAFAGLSNLTAITIPGSVTAIGVEAFRDCTDLTAIDLPNKLTELGAGAFKNCSALTQVSLPDGLAQIQDHTFFGCMALQEIDLPPRLDSIGSGAFEGTGLKQLHLSTVSSIGSRAYANCTALKTLYFGSSVPGIAADAFVGVKAMTYYPINTSVWSADKKLDYGGVLCWVVNDPTVQDSGTCGESLQWTINLNGVLRIFGFGAMPAYSETNPAPWKSSENEISAVILEKGVSGISAHAFANMDTLKAVSAASVETIDVTSFQGCTALETIGFSDSLKVIPIGAFDDCTALEKVILPATLETVAQDAFGTDPALEFSFGGSIVQFTALFGTGRRVTAREGTILAMAQNTDGVYWALTDNNELYLYGAESVSASIPETYRHQVQRIVLYDGAKTLDMDLTVFPNAAELTVPATVTQANIRAGSSLKKIHIPDLDSWAKIDFTPDGNPMRSDANLYINGNRLLNGALSSNAVKIGAYAFQNARLNTLYIPASVVAIGEGAFLSSKLAATYEGTSEAWMKLGGGGVKATCSDGVTLLGYGSCGENANWILKEDGTLTISGTGAMADYDDGSSVPWGNNADSIKKVIVKNGITSIGNMAFYRCDSMTTAELPDSVTRIGRYAFYACYELSQITLPENLTEIGAHALNYCFALKSIRIPKSVKTIGQGAFYYLEDVTIADMGGWCAITFSDVNANPLLSAERIYLDGSDIPVTEITVPSSVSAYAFYHCKSLQKINIPAGADIGFQAFGGCTNATLYYQGSFAQWKQGKYTSDLPVVFSDGTRVLGCGITDPANAANPYDSYHDNVYWVLSEEGELRLSGSGSLVLDSWNYDNGTPWTRLANQITSVVVEPGITSLCANTFNYLTKVNTIVIGPDVATIDNNAFNYRGMNATVIFQGCPQSIGAENFHSQTIWAYYRPADGWTSGMRKTYKASKLFWIAYTQEDHIFDLPGTAFKLTAKAAVPTGGLKEPDSTVMLVYGADKEAPLNPANLVFSVPESQQNIVSVDEKGVITAGSLSGTATVTATLRDDPLNRKTSVTIKVVGAPLQSLLLVPKENPLMECVPLDQNGFTPTADWRTARYNVYVDADAIRYEGLSFVIHPKAVNTAENIVPMGKSSLKWSTTDSKVATVKANSDGTATVVVKAGASGACGITAVTTNSQKISNTLTIYIRNPAPKLESNIFTLNTYYKYSEAYTHLSESFDNWIENEITIHEYDSSLGTYRKEESERLDASCSWKGVLTISARKVIPNGTLKLLLKVPCYNGKTYEYPITLKVQNSLPDVTVKQSGKFNLFYTDSVAPFTVSTGNEIGWIELDDDTTASFVGEYDSETGAFTVRYSKAQISDPKAKLDTKADILVYLKNYREPVRKSITIATTTVKPKLSVSPSSSTFNTVLSSNFSTNLYVYNHTAEKYVSDYEVTANFATVRGPYFNGRTVLALKAPYTGGTALIQVQERNWMQAITLTHKVTVQTTLPTHRLSKGTLSLNRLFTDRNATTVVCLNQSNLNIKDVTITSTARYGSAAAAEAQKINLAYDAKLNTICASIANPNDAPRNGTYSFQYVVTLDDEAGTRLPANTFAVKIYSSAPSFNLSSKTLSLNSMLGSNAFAESSVVLAKGENCKLVDLRIPGSWDESDIRIAFDPDTGNLSAELVNVGLANQKRTISLTPVVRCMDTGEEVVLTANPINITVQVYSGNPSVSVSAKGTLDTMVPNSAITYTVKRKNLTGKIESVRLEGTNAQLFSANADSTGENVVLKIADGAQCSVKTTYKLKMVLCISGQEFSVGISFKVKQSALELSSVSNLQIFQSQTDSRWFTVDLKSPSGATLESVTLSEKSDATFLKSGQPYLRTTIAKDGRSAELRLDVKNTGSLVRGKSYTVYLDVIPQNNATDVSPTRLKLTVKVS